MNPENGILRAGCFLGKNFFICQTIDKIVEGILQQEGVWKVKLETAEGHPEYHSLACPWENIHTLEVKHCGSQETLACKGCGGIWLAIIEKDSRLEYYPKPATVDYTEEGEIPTPIHVPPAALGQTFLSVMGNHQPGVNLKIL